MAQKKTSVEIKGFLSLFILHELGKHDLAGDDLAARIGKRKGSEPLTPGTIYPTLKRLRKLGLVKYKRFGRKKVYSITPKGKNEFRIMYEEVKGMLRGISLRKKKKTKRTSKKKQSKTSKQKRKK